MVGTHVGEQGLRPKCVAFRAREKAMGLSVECGFHFQSHKEGPRARDSCAPGHKEHEGSQLSQARWNAKGILSKTSGSGAKREVRAQNIGRNHHLQPVETRCLFNTKIKLKTTRKQVARCQVFFMDPDPGKKANRGSLLVSQRGPCFAARDTFAVFRRGSGGWGVGLAGVLTQIVG